MSDDQSEDVVYEGAANLQKKLETVGGRLILFTDRLVFEPHSLNVQKQQISIQLESISKIESGWTKLFGFIPLIPNALIISDGNQHHRVTVFNRKLWIKRIQECKAFK